MNNTSLDKLIALHDQAESRESRKQDNTAFICGICNEFITQRQGYSPFKFSKGSTIYAHV